MKGIVPKSPGTDICGLSSYCYVIRSDLGCYMRSAHLSEGSDLTIFSLHPSCRAGDHYLGHEDGHFYIIKGKSCRRVTDLSTDAGAVVSSLHPNCQGGDHYLSAFGRFYIIFQQKGIYRATTNLHTDADAVECDLHPNCRDGLYYWGLPHQCCFIKPCSEWGVEYRKGSDLNNDQHVAECSVHPHVLHFLPGGMAVTEGPAFGTWENIESVVNETKTTLTWQKTLKRKVGYRKEKLSQITRHWKMSPSAESVDVSGLIVKQQLSFSAHYGGLSVRTQNESWNELAEVEDQLTFELQPKEGLYVWQYKLGFGKEPVLFCRDLHITPYDSHPDSRR